MENQWKQCPRCGSKRVSPTSKIMVFVVLLGTGGCLIWLGLLFLPFLILSILMIVAAPVVFFGPTTYQCGDCKKSWNEKKKKESTKMY